MNNTVLLSLICLMFPAHEAVSMDAMSEEDKRIYAFAQCLKPENKEKYTPPD